VLTFIACLRYKPDRQRRDLALLAAALPAADRGHRPCGPGTRSKESASTRRSPRSGRGVR